jgi:hypothetical protein
MRGPATKVCEACNQAFECGQYGCWCAQVKITDAQMTWVEQTFHDCLCPVCLQKVVDGRLGPASIAKSQ